MTAPTPIRQAIHSGLFVSTIDLGAETPTRYEVGVFDKKWNDLHMRRFSNVAEALDEHDRCVGVIARANAYRPPHSITLKLEFS